MRKYRAEKKNNQTQIILFVANSVWNLINFRLPIMRVLHKKGFLVGAVAPEDPDSDDHISMLEKEGFVFYPVPINRSGVNPVQDIITLFTLCRLYKKLRPTAVCHFTIKPVIYGSLAAHRCGVRVINNISGLGTVFIRETPVTTLVRLLYKKALKHADTVFFQNPDDRKLFLDTTLVTESQASLLPGSGVDLEHYVPYSDPTSFELNQAPFRFLLIGRMLKDKGIYEFIEAARSLKRKNIDAEYILLGGIDYDNRTSISKDEINSWVDEGLIGYSGIVSDVRPEIAGADCIVLPSYREGTPRTLLEAAAMGKPIISTDVPGCKEVVVDGRNGFLCTVRDCESLAESMDYMVNLSLEKRKDMGQQSRKLAEEKFDLNFVIDAYLEKINLLNIRI